MAPIWPPEATRATDFNTDPGYQRTTDSDKALSSSSDPTAFKGHSSFNLEYLCPRRVTNTLSKWLFTNALVSTRGCGQHTGFSLLLGGTKSGPDSSCMERASWSLLPSLCHQRSGLEKEESVIGEKHTSCSSCCWDKKPRLREEGLLCLHV